MGYITTMTGGSKLALAWAVVLMISVGSYVFYAVKVGRVYLFVRSAPLIKKDENPYGFWAIVTIYAGFVLACLILTSIALFTHSLRGWKSF